MSTDFTLEFHKNHLHIQHSADFEISPESLKILYEALDIACKKYKCRLVLAQSNTPPKRYMDTLDAFESAIEFVKIIPGLLHACVLPGYMPDDTTDFFKTAVLNRGARIEFFTEVKDAFTWLGIDPVCEADLL